MDQKTPHNGTLGNDAGSGKDQTPESDFSLWELPDNTEDQSTANKIHVDGEFFKRVGFYSAFNKSSDHEFRQAVERLSKTVKAKVEDLKKELSEDLKRFTIRKEEADSKIKEIKTSIARYEKEVEELRSELPPLRARFESLRGEIETVVISIGTKKETLIKDRQEALLEELKRLNSELEDVVRSRMDLNEEIFQKQKDALEKKKAYWADLFQKYEREHAEVLAKLRLFSIPGFHVLSSTFLYNAGLVAATVAGAFFASFAEANDLASGGLLSFIIQGLFSFSTAFIGQPLNTSLPPITVRAIYAAMLLTVFLGLLALMFGASWVCQIAYQRLFQSAKDSRSQNGNAPSDNTNGYSIEVNLDSDELPVKTRVSEKSFLGFWIKVLPYLLLLLIVFVLVSLGTDIGSIKSLDASIAGYGTGFLIAIASGAIFYIYLTMFLERRIEQQEVIEPEKRRISWAKLNIELLGVILAFIAVVLITLLVFQHPFKLASGTRSIASLMFFAAGCLLTAFTLGFGIRLQSLEASRQELETQCDIIQTRLIRISRPLQIYLTAKENAHFNRKFIQIRDEIMNLMLARTMLTRRAIDTPLVMADEKRRLFNSVNRWLRKRFFSRSSQKKEQNDSQSGQSQHSEPSGFTTTEEIRLCFPKLEAELSTLEAGRNEIRDRIAFIEKEIGFRTEQRGEFYEKKLAELKHQEVRSRNYHKAMANRQRRSHYEIV